MATKGRGTNGFYVFAPKLLLSSIFAGFELKVCYSHLIKHALNSPILVLLSL